MNENLGKKDGKLEEFPLIEKEITIELTEHEVAELGRRNAEIEQDMAALEADFQKQKEEHRAKVMKLESERLDNNRKIRAGGYLRVVTCGVEYHWPSAVVRYWHEGRCVEERAMSPDELQMDWTKSPRLSAEARA